MTSFRNIYYKIALLWKWRYWPMVLLYLPLTIYVFFVAVFRFRKLFFFAAANPKVSMGGFAGDSKEAILSKVPHHYRPASVYVAKGESFANVLQSLKDTGMDFPLIAKPDLGESGFLVRKITNEEELEQYHKTFKMNFLIQEFISCPLEISVLFHNANGSTEITSITERQYLKIKGDGKSRLKELLMKNPNARYRMNNILKSIGDKKDIILKDGEILQPSEIGNWDFGATYIDRSDCISPEMSKIFIAVNHSIGLFNCGRCDIKCRSMEDFAAGNFKILEINGVKGEPIHIYDARYTLWRAYQEIFSHWNNIIKISARNTRAGFICPGIKEGAGIFAAHAKTKTDAVKGI